MNKLRFRGVITRIFDVETGKTKKGEWSKVSFMVKESGTKYPQQACFSLFGTEKVDNFMQYQEEGQEVTVYFNVSAREWNGKGFSDLQAWKIDKIKDETQEEFEEEVSDEGLPF